MLTRDPVRGQVTATTLGPVTTANSATLDLPTGWDPTYATTNTFRYNFDAIDPIGLTRSWQVFASQKERFAFR